MLTRKGGLTTSKSGRILGGGLENTPLLDLKTREVMSQGRQEAFRVLEEEHSSVSTFILP